MIRRESEIDAESRLEILRELQASYAHFIPFLHDCMDFLGFSVTPVQEAIGEFMENGGDRIMVQAQRGQAKTTIAACFCVFALIHNPRLRVLIVSAAGPLASDISTLIVRIINNMPELECMRPDKRAGDRESVEAFDIHHTLRGNVDKSPSVKCLGITANMQGNRADLLLADDVESSKNSKTPGMRADLLHWTKDFTSIVANGRIIWLGTPQSRDSIYGSLPARGVVVRIWPGRYPTREQLGKYQGMLAPQLLQKLRANPDLQTGGGLLGDQGQPTDPQLHSEAALQDKERDQGSAYFQLQHMLNSELLDASRYPLLTHHLILVSARGSELTIPAKMVRDVHPAAVTDHIIAGFPFKLGRAVAAVDAQYLPVPRPWAAIDPGGGGANADETGFSIGNPLSNYILLRAVGGVRGGYTDAAIDELISWLVRFNVAGVTIEKNYGHGAYYAVVLPKLKAAIPDVQVDGDWYSKGQKESRLCDTLEPIIGRGGLIITDEAVEIDSQCCEQYNPASARDYSFFHQVARIQRRPGALVHDDRLDATEILAAKFAAQFSASSAKASEEQAAAERDRRLRMLLKTIGVSLPNVPTSILLRSIQ